LVHAHHPTSPSHSAGHSTHASAHTTSHTTSHSATTHSASHVRHTAAHIGAHATHAHAHSTTHGSSGAHTAHAAHHRIHTTTAHAAHAAHLANLYHACIQRGERLWVEWRIATSGSSRGGNARGHTSRPNITRSSRGTVGKPALLLTSTKLAILIRIMVTLIPRLSELDVNLYKKLHK
jgi:hypothetical protein